MKSAHVLVAMLGFCVSTVSIADPVYPTVPPTQELQIASYIPPATTDLSKLQTQKTITIRNYRIKVNMRPAVEKPQVDVTDTPQAAVTREELLRRARRDAELARATERLREVTRGFANLRKRGY